MTIRLLGRGAAFARRFSRRDDIALVDPALAPLDPVAAVDPAAAVADVVAVEPIEKTYRATVTRTVTQTAVVEFAAMEGTDTMTLAQGLLETIPPESWVTQPADSWGYIDQIEEVDASAVATLDDELLEPIEDPESPEVLARRRRALRARGFARKAAFDVTVDGVLAATYEAETADEALIAYLTEQGFATVDDAAAAAGLSVDEYLASVLVSEAVPATLADEEIDPEEEEEVPATMSRRGRVSRRARRSSGYARKMTGSEAIGWLDNAYATADQALAAGDEQTLLALQAEAAGLYIDPADPDSSSFAMGLADFQGWLAEQIQILAETSAAITSTVDSYAA